MRCSPRRICRCFGAGAQEEIKRKKLAAGELAWDIDGMREELEKKGLKYI